MSVQAASKRVKVLERAGLARRSAIGRTHHCRLEGSSLAEERRWTAFYERFWNERPDALETLVRTTATPDPDAAASGERES